MSNNLPKEIDEAIKLTAQNCLHIDMNDYMESISCSDYLRERIQKCIKLYLWKYLSIPTQDKSECFEVQQTSNRMFWKTVLEAKEPIDWVYETITPTPWVRVVNRHWKEIKKEPYQVKDHESTIQLILDKVNALESNK